MQLPFGPTEDFHDYRFDYASDTVRFYAGGRLMKELKDGIPQTSMHLMLNAWYPP